jgi:signal transduction histidine kinase
MPPQPPQRHPAQGNADSSHAWHSPYGQGARSGGLGDDLSRDPQPTVADFFAEALDSAMALVPADGGEIATLDDTKHALVLRARRTRPRLDRRDTSINGMGAPGRHSQPMMPRTGLGAGPSASYGAMSFGAGVEGMTDETAGQDAIEVQSTQLLPAAMSTRMYRKGERLIGLTWQRAEPVLLRGEDCRAIPGGMAPPDPDAAFHLAVPIFRPAPLATARPATDVIGVISVYNRDPLWSFSPRDVELLVLHADRIARAMQATELARQNQSQADLLNMLGSGVSGQGPQALYQRLRDLVRRMIDAPSFAVILYNARSDEVTFALAERDGQPATSTRMYGGSLPQWWQSVRQFQTVCVSAPEERAIAPEVCTLGWGDDQPVQSILAAPLILGGNLLGAIVAGSPRPDVYAREHARLFETIARSAAILIQNALLDQNKREYVGRTQEKERQLSVLNNAVLTVNASLDLDATLRALVREAGKLAGESKVCVVFLLNESGEYLEARAANKHMLGPHIPLSEVRVPTSWHELNKLLDTGEFRVLDNLKADWEDKTVGPLLAEQGISDCLVLPLTHKETSLGILAVFTPGQPYHGTTEEMILLHGLASQGAVAISNARLYRELQDAFERQKELDRMKDEFILTVSHEFRTPVTAIEGYVTLIGRHGHKLEQAKLDQFAGEIHQATGQLMGMINMLHDANTVDSHPIHMTLTPVSVNDIAESAVSVQAPEAQARMRLDVPSNLWIQADAEKLPHVFSNLLSNAVKYSSADKPIQITARVETREQLARQGRPHAQAEGAAERWVVIGVRDWGDGITAEDQPKLFQKFVRLPRSLTTSVRGTGLGLWICRRYLDTMGGDIWVESEFGLGSHFQFCLPCVAAPEDTQAQV